ncbi:alpha/beta fold hydrolase [Thermaurantiacus tibetensis]|uniref:alpha/beta fold hydrolase n=1 Tax=Thermaurantiacus tibetensis TaxID=2759035 RepID=UPI00188DF498|nr:alpha/beta hydrolase [Thermaurantiacus tibetensis]
MTLPPGTFVPVAGGAMHARAWPAPEGGSGAPLVLVHATGMCGAIYADLLGPLAGQPARDFAIWLPDMRGHGLTRLPATPGDVPVDWLPYRADLLAFLAAVSPGAPVRLAGHSFGATVAAELAAAHPERVEALLLLDPAFVPFDHAPAYAALRAAGEEPPNPMAEGALRRRPGFAGRAEARARLRERGVFAGWPEAALEAYLEDGLDDDGGLRCTPGWEATSFRGVSTTLAASLAALRTPFALLAAADGSTVGEADFAAFARHPACRLAARVPGGHFFPVTSPEAVRPRLAALAGLG